MTETNISILVTRPKGQADAWLQAFQQQGWKTTHFPTLDIQPLDLTPEDKNIVLGLDQYRGVVCISANAAELGLELLADYWTQWPVQQTWYAVGPATAEAMSKWLVKPRLPAQHNSEGLLGLASLKQVEGERYLILKGEGGRETLRDTLQRRGALVDELALYRRAEPQVSPSIFEDWISANDRKLVVVSSGDGLKNLMKMVPEHIEALQAINLVVVSERLAEFAKLKGFANVIVSAEPSCESVIAVVQSSL